MKIKVQSSKLEFKVNYQKLLQNLFDFKMGSAATEVLEVYSSKEATAFSLLFNTTHRTNISLAKELGQEELNRTKNLVPIYSKLENDLVLYLNEKVILTKEFFDDFLQFNPDYLVRAFQIFKNYLLLLKIAVPEGVNYKYFIEFRKNLLEEYNSDPKKYKKLADFFERPLLESRTSFEKQIEHYKEIGSNYSMKLQSGIEDSNETLKDLYIAPFFKIFKKNLSLPISGKSYEDFEDPKEKMEISSFLNQFVLHDCLPNSLRENYNMIFILGQPGQGKTSLCYKLIYDILKASHGLPKTPLFFIKIRDLHAKDFVNDTFNTLKQAISQNIDFSSDNCLLVLDGLDEAYMNGGLTDGDLKNLYERLNKSCRNNKNLKIILTSRLNYLDINDPSVQGSLVLKLEVFDKDQIKEYLNKFSAFYPNNLLVNKVDEIFESDHYNHIEELLEQPVLMYFIALTNIAVEENDSKAKIYNKIFDSLAKRSWDKNGQLSHIKEDLRTDHKKYSKYLRQYIRSLAFEIYQSPSHHITINRLIRLDSTKQFINKTFNGSIISNEDAIRDTSKYLLVSFYFQSSNKSEDGDAAIEFFHNSLWEYLTAEFIWEEIKRTVLVVDEDEDLLPVRLETYFNVLKKLVGNKDLKIEIRRNLENIIKIENSGIKEKVFNQSNEVFNKLVRKGILLSFDWKSEALVAKEKIINIFELAWTLLYWTISGTKTRIICDAEVTEHFFDLSSNLHYNNYLRNIDFHGPSFGLHYLTDCSVEDVIFSPNGLIEEFHLFSNQFVRTTFSNVVNFGQVRYNSFNDVIFKNVAFNDYGINKNTFKNVKFLNVLVSNEDWLEKFIGNNEVDKAFKVEHKLVINKIQESNGKENYEYYLNHISNLEDDTSKV